MPRNPQSPIIWHGGKVALAPRIVALMPKDHTHYVEPFVGGGAVLLAKDPTDVSEVVNDLDGRLSTFWDVLKRPAHFAEFVRLCEATPFSEVEWDAARIEMLAGLPNDWPAVRAHRFFVFVRQSMAGRMTHFSATTRTRTRRGMNQQASGWLSAVAGLPAVHERLMRVVVRNAPAVKVIRQEDGPETLFYLDPPYLPETRANACEYGSFEMDDRDHEELLRTLGTIKGRFLLSGYPSAMYAAAAKRFGWRRFDFEQPMHASGGKSKRRVVECVWRNY